VPPAEQVARLREPTAFCLWLVNWIEPAQDIKLITTVILALRFSHYYGLGLKS